MSDKETAKRFGIRCTLPPNDPMAAPHLLGPKWESFRWFATAAERDLFLADYGREHLYSRPGDTPSIVYTKIER